MKDQHCNHCGAKHTDTEYPKACGSCKNLTFLSVPAVVACITYTTDPEGNARLILVRRAIPPAIGKQCLPGGYMDVGETWQEACARELTEETGLITNPLDWFYGSLEHATGNTHLMVFAECFVPYEQCMKAL